MKYLYLIFSSLKRKKLRTGLTILSLIVAFLLFGYLVAIRIGDLAADVDGRLGVPRSFSTHGLIVDLAAELARVVARRDADRAFRLEEQVLRALRSVGAIDDDVRLGKTGFYVALVDLDVFQQVAIAPGFMHYRCGRPECGHRIGDRRQFLVIHFDQVQRPGGNALAVSGNNCHCIPAVTYLVSAQDRPVEIDRAMEVAPGYIIVG